MKPSPKIELRKIFAPENRGILLDLFVFVINISLMVVITRLSKDLIIRAEEDYSAKALIGLYFAGLFFLQPVGPVLKRWSFHRETKFDRESAAGCFLLPMMFFYLVMMVLISGTASIILTEVVFEPGTDGELVGPALVLFGFGWSFVNAWFVYRYFVRPRNPPLWDFLATRQSMLFGDICMFLNVIALQILWNNLTSAESFWQVMLSTPLGKPGSFTDVLGRFIVIGALAMMVYFPGRIFYLVEERRRKIVWFTMLLANLPLLFRAVFSSPR